MHPAWWFVIAVSGWLAYELSGPHPIESRRVTVEGRVYNVRRYKGGRYEVDRIIDGKPVVRVNFDQQQLISQSGDPVHSAAMMADMARFPQNMFAGDFPEWLE